MISLVTSFSGLCQFEEIPFPGFGFQGPRTKGVDVTVLGLVGGAPGGETPRVADSSAAGAGRFFHNSVPPSKLNRLGKPPRTMCNVRPFNQLVPRPPASDLG